MVTSSVEETERVLSQVTDTSVMYDKASSYFLLIHTCGHNY